MKQELLETEEFYNLMQDYRHAIATDQDKVARCFGNVKSYLKTNPKMSIVGSIKNNDKTAKVTIIRNKIVVEMTDGAEFRISLAQWTNGIVVNKFEIEDSTIKIEPNVSNEITIY